jgi:hypothetical protein
MVTLTNYSTFWLSRVKLKDLQWLTVLFTHNSNGNPHRSAIYFAILGFSPALAFTLLQTGRVKTKTNWHMIDTNESQMFLARSISWGSSIKSTSSLDSGLGTLFYVHSICSLPTVSEALLTLAFWTIVMASSSVLQSKTRRQCNVELVEWPAWLLVTRAVKSQEQEMPPPTHRQIWGQSRRVPCSTRSAGVDVDPIGFGRFVNFLSKFSILRIPAFWIYHLLSPRPPVTPQWP